MRRIRDLLKGAHSDPVDPRNPRGLDLQAPGSRFSNHVAIAVPSMHEFGNRAELREPGIAEVALREKLGPRALDDADGLGTPEAIDGSWGRGAASWIPVLEFVGVAIAGGITWDAIKAGIGSLRTTLRRAEDKGEQAYISRGAAAVLAIGEVIDRELEDEPLDIEVAEEPSGLAGQEITETSYTGFEPWIVSLINREQTVRYVVAVAADGKIEGLLELPISQGTRVFGPLPPQRES